MSTRVAGEIVGAVPGVFALACAYDLSGNRTSLVAVAAGGAVTNTTTYLYGSGNRLLSDTSESTTNTYAYTPAGQLATQTIGKKGPDPKSGPESENIHRYYDNTPEDASVLSVGAHGNRSGMYSATRCRIDIDELAEQIRQHPKYDSVTTIRLDSCNVGNGPYAQHLANRLGKNVTAPNNLLYIFSDGSCFVTNGGFYVPFSPSPTH